MTITTLQDQLLKQHDETQAAVLKAKIQRRGGSGATLTKCSACGDYRCSCRCPGCEICGGSGYVRKEHGTIESGTYNVELKPCPNMTKRSLAKAIEAGEGRGGLTADELRDLKWDLIIPGISDGHKALQFVRPAVERGYGMGIMLGKWGQAKTLLMKIAVAEFIRAGKSAHYVKLTTLMDDIRKAYDEREGKMTALVRKIDEWKSYDLLALDEIDKDAGTDWAESRMFDVVDDRWTMAVREKALTLFASNYGAASEIPGYLRSRIEDNRFSIPTSDGKPAAFCVYLNGADGRKSMLPGRRY